MLELSGIFKSFAKTHVLNSLSFKIQDNRILGLLGPNGSGKTTTFRVIAGLMQADAGDVLFEGQSTKKNRRLLHEKCGFLLGNETGLYDRLTTLENILFFSSLCHIGKKEAMDRTCNYAEILGFTTYLNRPVHELSKGTKQKIALTRSLIHNPEVIFFDEPTSGFDIDSIESTHNLILSLKKSGRTIVLASHILSEIESLCDDIVILSHGKAAIQTDLASVDDKYGGVRALYQSIRDGNEAVK